MAATENVRNTSALIAHAMQCVSSIGSAEMIVADLSLVSVASADVRHEWRAGDDVEAIDLSL